MSAVREALAHITAEHLQPCGPCDGGLPMSCTCGPEPRIPLARLVAALEAVLDLHQPHGWAYDYPRPGIHTFKRTNIAATHCGKCGAGWPCATVEAIEQALTDATCTCLPDRPCLGSICDECGAGGCYGAMRLAENAERAAQSDAEDGAA